MKSRTILKKIAALSTGVVMLGATMTGALALSYTLSDYPQPFIKDGIFNGAIAVGQNAAASDSIGQSILLTQLQTMAVSPAKTTRTVDGDTQQEINLGESLIASGGFSNVLTDYDIDTLLDTTINFKSGNYDVSETVVMNDQIKAETSLTSSEDDYTDEVFLEIAKGSLRYYYNFDNSIALNESTTTNLVKIKFLGKNLKIIDIKSDTRFTAYVGKEYFLNVGDSAVSNGKNVKLDRVGTVGAVVINVDGTFGTISAGDTKTINGVEITNDETFYDGNNQSSSAANLVIGENSLETFKNGDPYVGEDKNNPDWIWNIQNLNSGTSTDVSISGSTFNEDGPVIGIKNDFIYNDASDNPPAIGECIELPNDYVSICLDSLTVEEEDYALYRFEYDKNADLSDVNSTYTDEKTIHLFSSQDEAFITEAGNKKTKDMWIHIENENKTGIYYKNDEGDVVLDGWVLNQTMTTIGKINYENTDGTAQVLKVYFDENELNLTLESLVGNDDIVSRWKVSGNDIVSLGDTLNDDESNELYWDTMVIGTKDENHRTRYGIVISNPKSRGNSDEVELSIPNDRVKANVVIKGDSLETNSTSTETKMVGGVFVNPIPSTAIVLAEEITSTIAQNLIVVGGPAVNPLAKSVFGLTAADFTPNEAMVRLADNGNKLALLVAGYSAMDTRNAAEAVVAGKLKDVSQIEIRVLSPSQQLRVYTIETE